MPGWTPREIDLGGGYSYPGDPTGRALRAAPADTPSPADYAAAVAGGLDEGLRASGVDPSGIALEIEPGRAVYGSAGAHLSTVLNVKRQAAPVPRVWVGCDSSEVLLSDTGWEHSRWEPVCAEPVTGPDREVDVVGVSCGFDTMTPGARLPDGVAAGDVIAFLATGAYEETLAGNFNSMPRPASVLVSGDRAELVRRAEMLSDVTRRDRLPRRLRGEAPRVVGVDNVSLTVADVDLGSRILELLQYRSAAVRRPIASRQERPGSVHIGLRVDDAAAVHGRLVAAGVAPLSPPRTLPDDSSGWSGSIVFYVRDPDGVMLEIVERAEAASRVPGVGPVAVADTARG